MKKLRMFLRFLKWDIICQFQSWICFDIDFKCEQQHTGIASHTHQDDRSRACCGNQSPLGCWDVSENCAVLSSLTSALWHIWAAAAQLVLSQCSLKELHRLLPKPLNKIQETKSRTEYCEYDGFLCRCGVWKQELCCTAYEVIRVPSPACAFSLSSS